MSVCSGQRSVSFFASSTKCDSWQQLVLFHQRFPSLHHSLTLLHPHWRLLIFLPPCLLQLTASDSFILMVILLTASAALLTIRRSPALLRAWVLTARGNWTARKHTDKQQDEQESLKTATAPSLLKVLLLIFYTETLFIFICLLLNETWRRKKINTVLFYWINQESLVTLISENTEVSGCSSLAVNINNMTHFCARVSNLKSGSSFNSISCRELNCLFLLKFIYS